MAVCAGLLGVGPAFGEPPGAGTGLWMSTFPLDDGRIMLLVIDPARRHAAVYHVDAAAGTMTLKSSRDISGDLMVGDFNAVDPKPSALKKMLEMGRPDGTTRQNIP